MAMLCIYPNGDIYSSPPENMSDDYFVITETTTMREAAELVNKHFGNTRQKDEVWSELCLLAILGSLDR